MKQEQQELEFQQELELLEGFRKLSPIDRNIIITSVSMAVSAEQAIKRQYGLEATPPQDRHPA
jgi:hypothetical protein